MDGPSTDKKNLRRRGTFKGKFVDHRFRLVKMTAVEWLELSNCCVMEIVIHPMQRLLDEGFGPYIHLSHV